MALRFLNSGYFAGKVGIGIETPTAPLDVFGVRAGRDWAINNRAVIRLDSNGAAYPSDILFGHTAAANQTSWTGAYWSLSSRGSSDGNKFHFYRASGNPTVSSEAIIMTFDPDLNVGIGTTTPSANLYVSGSNADATDKPTMISESVFTIKPVALNSGNLNFAQVDGGNSIGMQYTNGPGTANWDISMQPFGGNVGIGTVSPGYTLEIAGPSTTSFAYQRTGVSANKWGFHSDNDATYWQNLTSGNLLFTLQNGGNVGINTTSPDFKLDVDGTLGVSGLPLNTDSVFALVADEILGSQLVTNGNFATNSDWNLGQGQWTITGGFAVASNNAGNILHTSAAVASGNGLVHKVIFTLSDVTSGYIRVGLSNPATTQYSTNGTYTVYIESSGNNYLYFHPYGFTGKISNVSTYEVVNNQVEKRELGTGAFGPTPVGAYLPLSGGTMTGNIDFVNNKDISMTDNAGAVTRVMVLNTSNTMYIGPVDTYAGGSILYGVAAGVSFQRFFTGASERLRIGSNGNVAIGTTATSYRLQVEQNNNGNLLSRFHNTAANGQGLLIRAGGVSSANRILQLASENDTKVMTVNSNGRVGIGIANPTEKLEVVGNVLITAALLSNQENTDIDTGAEVVAQVSHATYTAAFFDFVVKKGTNVRSGTVYACHNGDTTPLVEFTETSTNDLGDTSDVTLSVDISGTNMRLLATVTSDDWSVKSLIRAI